MVLIIAVLVILCAEQTLLADILQTPDNFVSDCGSDRQLSFAAIAIKKEDTYEYFCGGSLVNTHNVITTKSCAKKYPDTLYASFANGGTTVKVQRTTVYNKSPDDRGISLLKLAEPIPVSATIQPLCLPGIHKSGSSLMYTDNSDAGVWTATDDKIESAVVTNIPITSSEDCAACFGDVHDLICANKPNLPDHIGGNIIKKMEESHNGTKYVLMGLFTELKPNCDSKEMVAVIDVSYYLNWMYLNLDLTKSRRDNSKKKCDSETSKIKTRRAKTKSSNKKKKKKANKTKPN